MARSAEAAGADALVVAEAKADVWNPNAIRASTGAVFTLPVVEATLGEIAGLGVTIVAAAVGAATRYTDADLSGPVAIVVGAEDAASARAGSALPTLQVAIPVAGRGVDSLNAATAAAILLFEAVRQRG